MLLPLLSLLVYITTISSQAQSEELFASDTVSYDGRDFTFHEQRLSWSEAASLCRSTGGSLAIVNSMAVAKFLVDSQATLPEQREYEDVWIGGRYKNGKWIWKSTGEVFPSTTGEDGFPPWVNQEKNKHNCLLLDRYESTSPMFVDQECGSLRSFVCEKAQEVKLTTTQSFEDNGRRYYVYKGPVSWDRAVAVCRDNGSYLALVNDLKEAKFLATALMTSSFNVRFAWLGGRLEEGSWEWLKTGDTIPSEIQSDGFPPWENGHAPLFGSECLILDRANGKKPNFVSSNCTSLRSFVCEQEYSGNSVTKRIFKFHGYEFLLFSQKMTWDSAVDACRMENAQLAAIEDMNTAQFIATSMAKSWESLHMIWLGARQQQNHKWKWLMTGDELVPSPEDHTGYPPWRLPATQRGVDCLTMERAVHDKVYFLQRRCEISEAFLCQRDLTTAEPVLTSLVIGDRNFTIHEKPETWERALDVCKSENSHLAVLRENEEVQVLNNVSDIRRLWLGGHWIADKWMWIQIGETIPEVPDEEGFPNWSKNPRPKPNYDCLQLDLRKVTKPKLAGHTCEHTLGYLCEKIMKTEDVHEYQGLSYVVYNKRVTWEEAAAICHSKGYYLAIASDLREAQFLAHLTQEYYELWLGGVAHNDSWEWEHTGENIPSIPQRNGYPPWVEEPTVADHNCLTINRAAEGQPVFVKTQCDTKQSFVCEKGGSKLSQMLDAVSFEHNERVYTFHPQPVPWLEALEDCQENGGSLAVLQDLNTTRFITEISPYSPDVWAGAEKIEDKNKWHWISSEEQIPPRQEGEEYPPWARPYSRPNHDCLAVNKHNPDRPIFVDLPCNESHPYVCEKADHSTEPLIEIVPLADRELIFIETKANFKAAEDVCDGYNGMLAILNTPDLLAVGIKHAAKYRDVWIGAEVDSEGVTQWKHTGQEVPFLSTRAITVWEEENEMVVIHDEYKVVVNRLGIKSDIPENNEQDVSNMTASRSKRHTFGHEDDDGYTWYRADETKTTSWTESTNLYTASQNIYETTQNNFESPINNHHKQQLRKEHWTPAETPSDESFKTEEAEESSSIYYTPEYHQQKHIPEYAFSVSIPLSLDGSENITYPYPLENDSDDLSYSSDKFQNSYSIHTSQNDFTGSESVSEPFSEELTSAPFPTTYILKQKGNTMEETVLDEEWDKESDTRWREITQSTLRESTLLERQMTSQRWDVENTMDWRTNFAQETTLMEGLQRTPQIQNWDDGNSEDWPITTPWQQTTKAENWVDSHTGEWSTATPQETTSIKRKISQQGTALTEKWEEENSRQWRTTTERNVESYKETSSTGKWLQEITEDWRMTESQETITEGSSTDKYVSNSWTDSEEYNIHDQIEQQKKQRKDVEYSDSKPKLGTATVENDSIAASPSLKQNKTRCLKLGPNGFVVVPCRTKHSILCERRTNSSEPVMATYRYNGRSYGVSSQKVTWEEANIICQTNNSYLAVLTTAAETNFLANISSEFQDLWIGARVIDEVWEWEHTGQNLPGTMGKNGFPPWVNSPTRPGYNCLNLYRQGPGEVLFVDRKCHEEHGFICEDVNTGDTMNGEPSLNSLEEAYQFDDRIFVFNNKLLNWDEAAEYCVSYEGVLAAFKSMDELKMLENINPSFHDLWVGGHVQKSEWIWEQYHEKILGVSVDTDVPNKSSNSLKPRQSGEPAVWVNNYTRPGYNCASIYRETDNEAFLMEAKCNTRHGFVCELISDQTLHFRGRQYTFYVKRLNWTEAKEFCTSRGQYLAVVDDFEEAAFLADVGKVFRTMWIGAHYKAESPLGWTWDHTGEAISSDLGRFQTWIRSHQMQYSSNRCLSLFHPADNSKIFVNSSCDQNLAFVCEETDVDKLPGSVQVFFNQRPYTFYSDLLTWKEAVEACRENGSYLAVVSDAEEAEFIAGNIYGFHDVWVGGHKEADHWGWVHTGQYLPPVPSVPDFPRWSVYPQRYHKDCTNIYRNTNGHYMFIDRYCEERRSYVCEESGDLTETHSQTYIFQDSHYTFYTKAVSWNEATDICLSSGEYLAIVDTPEIANFIALNVSGDFHDLWVDGHLEDDHWMWTRVGREIPMVQQNAGEIFPPWIHIPSRPGHECLNLYRPDNTEVQFLDRKCDEKFSFICEYGTGSERKVQSFEFKGRTYTFYSDKLDWNKANSICRSNGTYLAIVSSKNEADFLVKVGGEFLNLWIGGRQMNGTYVWNHTGEIFPTKPGPDGFPVPFMKNAYITGDACINVGRVTGRAVFVDRQCEALHSFVCEDSGDKGETRQVTYKYNKQLYTVSSSKVSWDQAAEYCAANGSYLAIINSKKEFQFLSKIAPHFHDLWLGAREYGGMWKWEHTGESLIGSDDSQKSSNYSKINKFKPAWVESYWEDDGDKCLNVYRRNPTESLFIGQPCNRTFGFVCESSPIGSEPKTTVVTHKGRKYALHNQLVTWPEAVALCRASGSYLAVVTDLGEAWSIAAANIKFHDLWLGGHMREYHWEWENTGQPLDFSPNMSTGYPPWIRVPQQPQHNCINLYSDSGRPYFVDRRCRELHGYVCEEASSDENTSIVEYFGGHRYVFVNKHVTWSTAVENCKAMQGYLAVASDNDELRFIVNGTRDFHDVWIGGHMSNSHWEWDHTGQKLLTPSASPNSGSEIVNKLIPQWIRFPTRPVHDCLSVYRDNNNSPYLLDSRCNSQHTYVCEDVPVNPHKKTEVKQYKHRNYILVYERVSWDEAVRVCHARGGYLAVPDDLEEARFLASASADLHDVWVGGARRRDHPWEWTHTGRLIGANILWASSQPQPAHDCVNLYRDRGSKPLLVARRCAQRFGFICEDTTDTDPVSQVIRFRGRNYFFSNQAETWETAANICRSRGSYLAVVGDIDEADFIATVSRHFHDVWVGGSLVNGLWKWQHTGQTIPNKRPTEPLGKDGYPPWLANTTRPGHDCLNVYRGAEDTPSFIDRLCDEKHAYVCEEAGGIKNAESLQEFNGRVYKFYSRRVTWDHAVDICKESGSYLAVVTEPDEALFIARSGKDFHDLWIGGKLDHEKWEWDHTGQLIPLHNPDPSVFPQWSRETPVINNECLNIYRDDDSKPLFVDRHCSELNGFVCEEAADTPSENQVFELNGNLYIFTPNKMIWSDAYDTCMNNGSTLPVVLDSQTAIFLSSAGSEYHNIWLSGYLEDTHWVWKPKDRRIPTMPGDDGFPAWVRSMPRPEHECLSLYRDSENKPFLLDTRCEEKRMVVCQKFNNNLGEFLETFMHDDRRFVFVHHPETWSDASEICRRNGSFLAIISDHATSRAVAKHIGSVPDIWTGGRLQEHRWFWELSGEEVLSMKDDEEFPVWIGEPHHPQFECMALDSQIVGQPRFADRDCSTPKPFVCESGCLPLTPARRGQWSRTECLSRVGMRDEVCELTCHEGFELWGSRRLVCSNSGWNGTKPQCVTPDKLAYEFVERLNATLDAVVERSQSDQLLGTGIMFVIGKTTTLGHAGYDQITEFLKATVAAVRLSPSQVSAGVITYGPEVVLEIPLNTSDTCDFIDEADQMLYDHPGDNVDLQEALSLAKEHIENTGLYERTVIVLIMDADSTEDPTEVITELKSLGHKFFVIGIGTSVSIENLEAMASEPIYPVETTPNFYLLSSLQTFGNMVSYLNETYLYNSDLDCCMLLRTPAHGQWKPAQCSEGPGNLHDTCSILCEEGFELVGDLKLTCTEHGWYGESGKGHIPSCQTVVMVTRSMFDRMDEAIAPLDDVGILFLVDQSTSMSILDFQKQTAFVKMIVNKFSLSKTRTAGLITFNTKAIVKVPLNTSDTCSFLVALDQLNFEGGGTSFSAALQAAEEEISLHGENSTTVLFLMTDGHSYGNPKVVADRLKADGHIIFTLGVGGYKRRQLEALASVGPNQQPQFFSLADFEALKAAVSYINSTLMKSSEKHCCLKLDPDVSGVWDPPNCAVAPSEEQTVCSLSCDPGYELFGSDQLSCSADGWGATMPTCFAKPDLMGSIILYQLKDLLEVKEESASIVFLVDHTDTLSHESFDMLTEFIKLIASRFPLSNELTAGMIVSYKYGTDVAIPLNTNDTCRFLNDLDKIRREKGSPSLSRALRIIRKLSESYDEEQNMIIVLLTDRQVISKPSVSLAKKLKSSGKSIIVIGINNRVVYNDLFRIASGEKKPNNMIIIDTYDTLESVTDYMMDVEKQLAWYIDTGYNAPDC